MMQELKAGGKTVALLIGAEGFSDGPNPITPPEASLQMLVVKLAEGKVVAKHTHKKMERVTVERHKAIIVLEGRLEALLCDNDGLDGESCEVTAGQCLLLINGGYTLTAKDDCIFYEFKNGPHVEDKVRFN